MILHPRSPAPRLALTVTALLCFSGVAQAQSSEKARRAAAQVLFNQADELMQRGQYTDACPKLEEVVKLQPGKVGAVLALGECYEGSGKLASAWTSYMEALSLALKANDAREQQARDRATKIEPRLSRLSIVAPSSPVTDIEIRRDDTVVGSAQWGQAVPVDPGKHMIEARAPGRKPWTKSVELSLEGQTLTVQIPALALEPPSAPSKGAANPTSGGPDHAAPAATGLGHDHQLGAFARIDIDATYSGIITAVGLSYGLGDHFEVAAAGVLGTDKGLWAGATGYILTGKLKPMVTAGMHLLFPDVARAGLHGAAGLQWDPLRHFGAFALAGVSYFPSVPAMYLDKTVAKVVFLPSVGIQGRL